MTLSELSSSISPIGTAPAAGHVIVWEFRVQPPTRAEFLQHYGPDGSWAQLFRRAPGFRGTELLHDPHDPQRYFTLDHWDSETAFVSFRDQFAREYETLDATCAACIEAESLLGRFESGGGAAFERIRDEFMVSDDPRHIDLGRVHGWLTRSYWSPGIPLEIVARAVRNSVCVGLFRGEVQIGFARVVTDRATYGYLCDVVVEPAFRGRGLGKWMVASLLEHPHLQGIRRMMLVTRDAHAVYHAAGFNPLADPARHLEKTVRAADLYGPAPGDAEL